VLPALIRKAHDAKRRGEREIVVWGTGTPRREFLHVDDCADALVHLLKVYSGEAHVNVGCGSDVSILELARMVCAAVGFGGNITHDLGKPDGTPRKLLSIDKLKGLGWSPTIGLEDGIARTYQWFLEQERAAHSRQVA
jgi:GDP-L-fucose synthase